MKVAWAVERSIEALTNNDPDIAGEVLDAKSEISRLADVTDERLSQRLSVAEPKRLEAFRLESEIIEYMKRIYYFAKRIAKVVAETNIDVSKKNPDDSVVNVESQKRETVVA